MAMSFAIAVKGPITRIDCTWTSDGSGDADGTTPYDVSGELVKGLTNPGVAPSVDYDIIITDGEGLNVLTACDDNLADRHTTTTEEVYFLVLDHAGTPLAQSVHPVVAGPLTVTVAAAGDTKGGVLSLFIKGTVSKRVT